MNRIEQSVQPALLNEASRVDESAGGATQILDERDPVGTPRLVCYRTVRMASNPVPCRINGVAADGTNEVAHLSKSAGILGSDP
jgi:hypothetical protein